MIEYFKSVHDIEYKKLKNERYMSYYALRFIKRVWNSVNLSNMTWWEQIKFHLSRIINKESKTEKIISSLCLDFSLFMLSTLLSYVCHAALRSHSHSHEADDSGKMSKYIKLRIIISFFFSSFFDQCILNVLSLLD